MVAQVAVVGDLLATLASGRLPAVYELRLLFGYGDHRRTSRGGRICSRPDATTRRRLVAGGLGAGHADDVGRRPL